MILSTRDALQSLYMTAWHLHRCYPNNMLKESLSNVAYWSEAGAFVATLPRQSGKTTLIGKMLIDLGTEKAVVINPISQQKTFTTYGTKENVMVIYGPSGPYLTGAIDYKNTHLFVDEYAFVKDLDKVLSHDWKTVTMLGTMKV